MVLQILSCLVTLFKILEEDQTTSRIDDDIRLFGEVICTPYLPSLWIFFQNKVLFKKSLFVLTSLRATFFKRRSKFTLYLTTSLMSTNPKNKILTTLLTTSERNLSLKSPTIARLPSTLPVRSIPTNSSKFSTTFAYTSCPKRSSLWACKPNHKT